MKVKNYPQGWRRFEVIPIGWGKCRAGLPETPDFMRVNRPAQKTGRPLGLSICAAW
ncbi:MAG: hypothetical protein WCA24_10710 [Thiomonas sp.]